MNFFEQYFQYADMSNSEAPAIYHRWTAISILSAIIGRNAWLPFGHSTIFPNQYVLIMGEPGTRKSTALNIGTKLLRKAGYNRFSADRSSKERFLMDMKSTDSGILDPDGEVDMLSILTLDEPSESYIAKGEFADFIGQNDTEFIVLLTNLWDCPPEYEHPKLTGKSVRVDKPVVNILGGCTAESFAYAIPPISQGLGFLSRVIIIYGEETGRKIFLPKAPNELLGEVLVARLKEIRQTLRGELSISESAYPVLDEIYRHPFSIADNRFKNYANRRYTHLLKIAIAIAASEVRKDIQASDVIAANTVLISAERLMPKALGEFGKSRHSDANNAVIQCLQSAKRPMNAMEIYKLVSSDVGKVADCSEILRNLEHAGKIKQMTVAGRKGYVTHHETPVEWPSHLIDKSILAKEEL